MKKLFLLLLMWGTFIKTGFAPFTLIAIDDDFLKHIQYISFEDRVNCFNSYYQIGSYRISALREYKAPIVMYLCFGTAYVICDPQQLFKLYDRYEWIRACDIEEGCRLLTMFLKPVIVTEAHLRYESRSLLKFSEPFIGYYNFFVTDLCINVCNY
jgi:hypothetical protein